VKTTTATTTDKSKRLTLNRQTLRTLANDELRLVKGGAAFRSHGCHCEERT
jgi:hypothetical protein